MTTVLGSLGVSLLLVAYAGGSSRLLPDRRVLAGMNVLGASLACIASALLGFLPFVILEAAWVLAAFVDLRRHIVRSANGDLLSTD